MTNDKYYLEVYTLDVGMYKPVHVLCHGEYTNECFHRAMYVNRSRAGVRGLPQGAESDAPRTHVDSPLLLHAFPSRHRQSGKRLFTLCIVTLGVLVSDKDGRQL